MSTVSINAHRPKSTGCNVKVTNVKVGYVGEIKNNLREGMDFTLIVFFSCLFLKLC